MRNNGKGIWLLVMVIVVIVMMMSCSKKETPTDSSQPVNTSTVTPVNTSINTPTNTLTNTPTNTNTPIPMGGGQGKIAFVSNDTDGDKEIYVYVMDANGGKLIKLTDNSYDDMNPVWSPDGNKITFVRFEGGSNYEIYVMDADGSNQVNLTNNIADDGILLMISD